MTPKSVLPVHGVEVLSDGQFISPIPAVSTVTSEHAGWDGVAFEYYCNVPGCDIAEHEHPHISSISWSANRCAPSGLPRVDLVPRSTSPARSICFPEGRAIRLPGCVNLRACCWLLIRNIWLNPLRRRRIS